MEPKPRASKIPTPVGNPKFQENPEPPKVAEAVKKLESNEVDETKKNDPGKSSKKEKEPTLKEYMAAMTANIAMLVNSISTIDKKMEDQFKEVKDQIDPAKLENICNQVENIAKTTNDNSTKIEANTKTLESVMSRVVQLEREREKDRENAEASATEPSVPSFEN